MKIDIVDYGMNGEGVGKLDGKICLIQNALIGENIDAELIKDMKNYSILENKKINKISENRVKPICPYYNICGGCDLQHMSYTEQIKFKQLLVKKTIKKICAIDVDVRPTIASKLEYGYRNKISLTVNNNKIGFYKYNTNELVEIKKCFLASEKINKIIKILQKFLKNNEKISKNLKNVVIREINSKFLIGFVSVCEIDVSYFINLINNQNLNFGVYEIINTRQDKVVLSGKTKHIYGLKEIENKCFDLTYSVDLLAFHQTNIDIQNKIYSHVLKYISSDDRVVNGFSGQGLLSAIIANHAKKVVGIEINKSAHLASEKLKQDNNIKNLLNVNADFNKVIEKYKNYNFLILDPAKKGCGKDIINKIIGFKQIIYISCNPIALSKDINLLKDKYEIKEITPFDMFPNTKNVETFVLLKLKENL